MSDEDWNTGFARGLGIRLAGDAIEEVDERGNRIVDDTLLILVNAHYEPLSFILPAHRRGVRWERVLDTREAGAKSARILVRGGRPYEMEARSLALFRLQREAEAPPRKKVAITGPARREAPAGTDNNLPLEAVALKR